jgi:hypothetical protein
MVAAALMGGCTDEATTGDAGADARPAEEAGAVIDGPGPDGPGGDAPAQGPPRDTAPPADAPRGVDAATGADARGAEAGALADAGAPADGGGDAGAPADGGGDAGAPADTADAAPTAARRGEILRVDDARFLEIHTAAGRLRFETVFLCDLQVGDEVVFDLPPMAGCQTAILTSQRTGMRCDLTCL